jgi:hypothetical protein
MSTPKPILLVGGIVALYGALVVLGIFLALGSDYFVAVLLAPFSALGNSDWVLVAGMSLWVFVAVLIAMRRFIWCRITAAAVLAAHYVGVLIISLHREDWDHIAYIWRHAWTLIVLLIAAYCASQGFMWRLITRREHGA